MKKHFWLLMTIGILLLSKVNVLASNTYVINGIAIHYDDFSSSPNECWEYANQIYNKIWGQRFDSTFNDSNNALRNLSDSEITLTPQHLKTYVSNAALGSVLRICDFSYLHGSDGWGHSQIIVQKDNNGFTVFQGGLSASPYKNERYYTWNEYCSTGWLGGTYAYIKYIKWPGAPAYGKSGNTISQTTASNPEGYLDSVSGGSGTVTVKGWAFDRDSLGTSLDVHVYVGGPYNSGAPGYSIKANTYRSDVNIVYPGAGNYHGFSSTISTSQTGTQTVYVYAINIGGKTGNNYNTLIGTKTVTIASKTTNSSNGQSSVSKLSAPNVKLSKTYTNKVTLTWKKVSSAAKYQIYYVANGVDKKVGTLKSGNTRTITGLKSGRSYTFKVKAVEGKKSSDYATINVITRPDKVKLKSVSMNSQHKVKATWSSAYGADGYQYAISGNILFLSDKKYNTTKCQGNVTRKDLKKGKRYYYRVRAYKKLGNVKYPGAWSNIKSFVAK